MKKLFLFSLLAVASFSVNAQSVEVIDNGSFEGLELGTTLYRSGTNYLESLGSSQGWYDLWCVRGGSTAVNNNYGTGEIVTDTDEARGKVVKLTYTTTTGGVAQQDRDGNPHLTQRLRITAGVALEEGIYTLGFWAKSPVANAVISAGIKLTAGVGSTTYSAKVREAFKLKDFDWPNNAEHASISGSMKEFMLTEEWAYYTVEFDLSKVVSANTEPSWETSAGREYKIQDATEADRKELNLTMMGFKTIGDVYIDGVSLKKNDDTTTSVKTTGNKLQMSVTGNTILLHNVAKEAALYNVNGQLLEKQIANNDAVQFSAPEKGIYIVKADNIYEKILIK